MYLTYRFIFVLLDTYGRMYDAAAARLGWRDFRTSCRSFGGTAANLLVVALPAVEKLFECNGGARL